MSKLTKKQQALLVLIEAENDLDAARKSFLRVSGWRATSSTPGCYWMYEKTYLGKAVLVGEEHALAMAKGEVFLPEDCEPSA